MCVCVCVFSPVHIQFLPTLIWIAVLCKTWVFCHQILLYSALCVITLPFYQWQMFGHILHFNRGLKTGGKGTVHIACTWGPSSFSARDRQIFYCQTWLKHGKWPDLSSLCTSSLLIHTVPTGAASCTSTFQAPFKTTFIFPLQKMRQSLWWKALTVAVSVE